MIQRLALLADLQTLLVALRDDLRESIGEKPDQDARLRAEHQTARDAGRTADAYEHWREEPITQAAVAWVLASVFVRFLEDNDLVPTPRLSGPGDRLTTARDHYTAYFQKHPSETDREYLLDVFAEVGELPAARELFHRTHNPLWSLPISGDGARKLLDLWQRIDPATGALVHDFTDPAKGTRFLGDLYQDLSEDARKRYALLQTPEFVEEFILDRTLEPAIATFGFREVRLIDPTCGSGHFLLGAFARLFRLWQTQEPGTNPRQLAQNALSQVAGVDLNPFAVAIARFRLLVEALQVSGVARLKDAPGFKTHLAVGDSLLHGARIRIADGEQLPLGGGFGQSSLLRETVVDHHYASEDAEALGEILGQQYHAAVGNPPYITVKDKALNASYRQRFPVSCHMKYSLAVPFMERFFELAQAGTTPGYVGMITANSFMKREFGKNLIEQCIPTWDLTHVLDTSGAYIPGHGTPTVILFGRNRRPVAATIRAVMGIRGEPSTPEDPAAGVVWTAITTQVDVAGSQSKWVSTADVPRSSFHKHPWSIGGGGATGLKELLEERAEKRLGDVVESIGFGAILGEDDAFGSLRGSVRLRSLPSDLRRPLVEGEFVRDWALGWETEVLFPYTQAIDLVPESAVASVLWPLRSILSARADFSKATYRECGRPYWEYHQIPVDRNRTPLSIAFAFVATHNHFVFDRGGKVFNRTAPVVKLPEGATEDDHLALLGPLNSSTACFWMKQILFDRGGGGIGGGIASEKWEQFFEFDGTKLRQFPLVDVAEGPEICGGPVSQASPSHLPASGAAAAAARVAERVRTLDIHGRERAALPDPAQTPSDASLSRNRQRDGELLTSAIALQEELDWHCYQLYGLAEEAAGCTYGGLGPNAQYRDSRRAGQARLEAGSVTGMSRDDGGAGDGSVPPLRLGERAFEIVMARRMAAGELQTTWFDRHGSTPITDIPSHWPEEYRQVVERRIHAIETNAEIRLIEQPEYKRRWNVEPWEERQERALRSWLLDRLEASAYWPSLELQSCARLADRAHADDEFMQVAEVYRGRSDFDVTALVEELVGAEAVPLLPILRYKESGLRKRALWERTWELQRREDAGEKVETIEVPPKYASADFLKGDYWRLRGKLDVPKERFVSHPGCGRSADATLLVGWAGWDHLQQAQALAAHYVAMKDGEGWPAERLVPLLAGLVELLPWLEQWHNAPDPAYGMGLGEYFRRFVDEEARAQGLTLDGIRAWVPASGLRKRAGRAKDGRTRRGTEVASE
jgi:SAM-dependent methyltransferase